MEKDGAVFRRGAVRELERSVALSDACRLRSQPLDPTGTWRGVPRGAGPEKRPTTEEDHTNVVIACFFMPKRVRITGGSSASLAWRLTAGIGAGSWLVTRLTSF